MSYGIRARGRVLGGSGRDRVLDIPEFRGLGFRRGLGDCTTSSCPGPYDNPQFNYDYWYNQAGGAAPGAPAGQVTAPIPDSVIQGIQNQGGGPMYSMYDLYAQVGLPMNCDPRDVNCVMCEQEAGDAVQTYWNTQHGQVPAGTKISWSCDRSPQAMSAFLANHPDFAPVVKTAATGGPAPKSTAPPGSGSTGGTPTGGGSGGGGGAAPPPAKPPAGMLYPAKIDPTTGAVTPAGSGFSFASIPMWAWLAGAGAVVLFAQSGGRR